MLAACPSVCLNTGTASLNPATGAANRHSVKVKPEIDDPGLS
jgi:hypothetical protein